MKLLTQVFDPNHIKKLSKYADGFIFGHASFGTRLAKSYSLDDIDFLTRQIKTIHKLAFLVCNQLFTDDQLVELSCFLQKCPLEYLDGIIISDLGALSILESLGYKHLAVYHPETLLTNVFDFNFLSDEGILGAFVAKEIPLKDIIIIGKAKKYALFMTGHGHLNMFYSKRHLIEKYTEYVDIPHEYVENQNMRIVEEMRPDEKYPIFEDQAGTHVFRASVMSSIHHLQPLCEVVDYMIIDSLFKDDMYAEKMLKMYHQRTYDQETEDWAKSYDETWDEGFLMTETIYKQKKESQ